MMHLFRRHYILSWRQPTGAQAPTYMYKTRNQDINHSKRVLRIIILEQFGVSLNGSIYSISIRGIYHSMRNRIYIPRWHSSKTDCNAERKGFFLVAHVLSQYGLKLIPQWGRVTYICVGNLITFGSDNGFMPGRRQTIIRIKAGILLIGPLGTNFIETPIEVQNFSFNKNASENAVSKWAAILSRHQWVKLRRSYWYDIAKSLLGINWFF